MLQKKIGILGSFAVGKTSIVNRYANDVFSDDYVNTLYVNVVKETKPVAGIDLTLLLWDLPGGHGFNAFVPAYLRGIAGYILVVDPTRDSTYDSAVNLHKLVLDAVGLVPFVVVLNKCDEKDKWVKESDDFQFVRTSSLAVIETSAKLDTSIDEVFETLIGSLFQQDDSLQYASLGF